MPAPPTLAAVTLNLFTAAAGAGLLSFPYAALQQGLLANALATLACAAVTIFTDRVLVGTAADFRAAGALGDERTFDALAGAALGARARAAAAASILLGTGGALIGFLIIIGDLLEAPLRAATGCAAGAAGACALTSRAALIPAVALFVALPLSSLRALSALGHSSALAAGTVLAVAGVLVAAGARAAAAGGLALVAVTARAPAADAPADVVLARGALAPFFMGLPICIFALGNHCQVVPAFLECPRGSHAGARVARAIAAAVGACVALYLTTGAAGYVAFRAGTRGDVLLNLPLGDAPAGAAKVLLAIHVVLAFPVLVFPARETLMRAAARAAGAARAGSLGARVARAAADSPLPAAALLTAAAALAAVALPQVAIVFGLVGATCATLQIHALPAAYLRARADALEGRPCEGPQAAAWARVAAAVARRAAAAATAKGSRGGALDRAPLLAADAGGGLGAGGAGGADADADAAADAAADAEADAEPAVHFLSASPRVLRAQAAALYASFVLVATLGTGSFIASTWLGA
jgi:sodium-coupled neutral amino acid transporter 7/8